ncbi:quinone-modifying oxidoreductase subunit QmoB [Desulfobaculum xiamenense]|uniref:Quinone-modifying oxidoreductase subunit QmoB n=1 Tax=Desulfobaculum xiamenense TaxID=995050 RepID=A0A846QR13_9BACT|nr:FAD-dependent oxidoreductase [Desulfobaculum xiamenense]NJB68813.1 quinone-modifying oxidoreductase subunit QmoB [Desulfobaculum xiamenense]
MAEKIGVYFDESSIGQYFDIEALVEFVKTRWATACPVVTSHPVLPGEDGVKMIKADIEAGTIDAVLVCGSSPRIDWEFFDFGKSVPSERVNLREQCALCCPAEAGEETKVLMAKDYINMGVIKLQKTRVPAPEQIETVKTVLVVGGGWTGLHAALHAARAGYNTILIEKEAELGGHAAKLHKTIPLCHPYTEAHETGIEKLIADVQAESRIKVMTGTTIAALEGAPGSYTAKFSNGSEDKIGAVVLATGWVPQDASILEPLGYGRFKNVVTTWDVEEMAKNGQLLRPSDGKPAKRVAFLLNTEKAEPSDLFKPKAPAAPVEDEAKEEGEDKKAHKHVDLESARHLPYSSAVNSVISLKEAGYVTEQYTDGQAYIIYKDMLVQGIHEKYYKAAQDNPGVMLTKGTIVSVEEDTDGSLLVTVANTLLGQDFELKVDMVVVPTGIVPTTAKNPVMNFKYRQGPAFPDLDLFDGFCDSNYICFPYETRRTGVYAAGCVRQPMFMDNAEDDAAGAALKAIQCIESANRGVAVHPRSGDLTYPVFNFVRCTQCKRCTEECPFGALDDDETGTPKPNPTRCRRCGTCMGACPERVISFDNYNVDQIGSMIKAINVPDDMDAGGPRIVVLACENDAYPALDMAAMRGKTWSPYVRILPVRCLGSVNAIWVADAMSKGIDGVMMLGCKYGDDYQCHFVKGSEICNRRKENIAETLERLGVEPDRVEQYQVAIDEYDKLPAMIEEFQNMILEKGPNPFKGY